MIPEGWANPTPTPWRGPPIPPHFLLTSSSATTPRTWLSLLLPLLIGTLVLCSSKISAPLITPYHCCPWLSLERGQGPAARAGLGATHTGILPGSSDLGLTSPGMRPFANTQLCFLLLFSKTCTETSPRLSGFTKGFFSRHKDQECLKH